MKGSTRILITVLVVVAAAVVTVMVGVLPLRKQAADDLAVVQERRDELVKLQQVTSRINDLKSEIDRLEASLKTFATRLPESRKCDEVLAEVWKIAEANSMVPRTVRTSPVETNSQCSFQPVAITLDGRFDAFYQFLMSLERMPRIAKVRTLQVAKVPRTEGMVQADLLMDIYFETKP
jgi:Tfp pilus assembly protein PilO